MEDCACNEKMINITQESLEESESYFEKKSKENPFISINDNNFSDDNTDAINAQFYKDSLNDIPKVIKIKKDQKGRFDINSLPKCQLPIKINYSSNINNMINDGRKVVQDMVKPNEQKSVIANQKHDLRQFALTKSKLNWYGDEIPLEIRLTHLNTDTQGFTHIIFPIKLVNKDEKESNTIEEFSNFLDLDIVSKLGNEIVNLSKADIVSKLGNEINNLSKADLVSKIGNEINNLSKADIVSKLGNEINNLSNSELVSKLGNEITNLSKADLITKLGNEINNLSKADLVSKIGNEINNLSKADIVSKLSNEINNLSRSDVISKIGNEITNLSKSDVISKIGNEINNLSKSDISFKIGNEIRNLLKSDISIKIGNEIRKLSPSEVIGKIKEIDNKLPDIKIDKLDLTSIIKTPNVNLQVLNKKLEDINFNEIVTKFDNQKFSLNDINSLLNLNTLVEDTDTIPEYNCCALNYGKVVNVNLCPTATKVLDQEIFYHITGNDNSLILITKPQPFDMKAGEKILANLQEYDDLV
jgi:hypothetical protein